MRIQVALGALLCASPVLAQQDTVARRDTARLAPAVVTVTRSPLDASRVPFAVGVATREEIQRGRPGLALDEALARIPGVQVDNRFNYALGERISVRGIGARAQFGVRGVRVLLDGIPMTLADGQTALNNVDVSTLARAEVIRGPASMLHGNAAGGVIQLETDRAGDVTARPLGGEVRVVSGSFGLQRANVAVAGNRPGLDFHVAAARLRFDGFRPWSDARNDHANIRFRRGFVGGEVALVANIVDYVGKNPGSLSRAMLDANRDSVAAGNLAGRTGESGSQAQLGVVWDREVRGADVRFSVHGLQRAIENPIPGTIVAIERRAGGVRLAVDGLRQRWREGARLAAGVELQLQDDDRRNYANNAGARGAPTLEQRERVANASAFAQSMADLSSRVTLLGGLRFDRIAFRANDRFTTNGDDSGERTMGSVSPSVGLTWRVAPRANLYGNVSTAFESPTTSELANQESGAGGLNPQLGPQRALSTEVGVKGSVGERIIATYDVALHAARVRDALIPFQNSAGRTYYRNAASTTNRGIELAGSVFLPAGVSMRAGFTHLDARFDEYSVTTGTGTAVYDGNRVPGVAANRLEASVAAHPGPLFAEVDARVYSTVAVNDANTERADGYTLWGARGGLRALAAGAARVSPWLAVQNLFDRPYVTSVVVNAFGGRFFEPGPGRTVHGGVTVTF